jgi:hypothetical protein
VCGFKGASESTVIRTVLTNILKDRMRRTKTLRLLKHKYSCIGAFHHNLIIMPIKQGHRYFSEAGLKTVKWCHTPMLVTNAKILKMLEQGSSLEMSCNVT